MTEAVTPATEPRRRTPARTLGAALNSPDNALNAIRLGLALLVIFGHAFPLGGFAPFQIGPLVHGGLHGFAVDGFFVISGYLILSSGMRTTTLGYLWRRFLRIYPAWLVAIVVTAFVAAPLGALLEAGAHWEWRSAAAYVIGALDLKPSHEGVEATLLAVPWPETWNGSLWTLFYEAAAYVGIAVLCVWRPVRDRLRVIILPAAAILTAAYIAVPTSVIGDALPGALGVISGNGLRLWTFFAWGMVAYVLRDRIRATVPIAVAAGAVFLVAAHVAGLPHWLSAALTLPSLSVAVLFAGVLLPWRFGQTNDLSYGTYVYAFPVQQLLILAGIAQFGWAVTALACIAITLPLAWLSWRVIERPALSLKGLVPARKADRGKSTVPSPA
ncbi:acyltransferase family protein [Brachybacterium sp. DNPG3]